jgi:hypothetical protein
LTLDNVSSGSIIGTVRGLVGALSPGQARISSADGSPSRAMRHYRP